MRLQEKKSMRTGFAVMLLICAVAVRICLAVSAAEAPAQEMPPIRIEERISLRPVLSVMAEEPEPAQEVSESPKMLQFDAQDAENIHIAGACSYETNVLEALSTDWRSGAEAPAVLIVHTHGTESYTAEAGWEYAGSENQRTNEAAYSVVRVGRALAEALRAQGLTVYHDETMHDEFDFAGAYNQSRAAMQTFLQEHPEISLVIDLHRDAALYPDGSAFAPTVTVEGQEFARLMFVVGTDEGGLTHPGWRKNLGCAVQLQALIERAVPGLCRDVDLRTERFNQDLSSGALLIEMGAAGNTMTQVLRSAEVLAEAVAELVESG